MHLFELDYRERLRVHHLENFREYSKLLTHAGKISFVFLKCTLKTTKTVIHLRSILAKNAIVRTRLSRMSASSSPRKFSRVFSTPYPCEQNLLCVSQIYFQNHKNCRPLETYSYDKFICSNIIIENAREFITLKIERTLNPLPTPP